MTVEQQAPQERAAFLVSMLVLASAILFSVQFALQHDVRHLLLRVVDDASYYLTTARNIADGHGMTFDGVHATNGFHPLWLLMLVPLFLVHAAPETMIRLVVLLQMALLTAAFLLLYRTQTLLFSRRVALASAICFASLVFMQCLNGMESALFSLLLMLLYACGLHLWRTRITWRGAALFGLILGLLLLSRLDMIFIPLAMFGCAVPYVLNTATRARAIAAIITAGVATTAVVAPYLVFNLTQFGAFMPISGALKSSFPRIALSHATLAGIDHRNYAFAALAVAWVLWRAARTRRSPAGSRDDYYTLSTTVLAWAVILHFMDTILFMKWGVFAWHFVLYPLFAVLAFGGIFDALLRWRTLDDRPAVYWLSIAIMAVVVARKEYQREAYPLDHIWHVASYNAAVWAREHTPADTIFAMRDAGHFAFFSERRVINLDGLVNNLDYQRAIAAQRVGHYLRANHVQYLVLHALPGREDVLRGDYDSLALNYMSHKYDVVSDDVVVQRRDEVYRSSRYFDGPDPAVCLIWSVHSDATGATGAVRTLTASGTPD
jgi:hypothetical protein